MNWKRFALSLLLAPSFLAAQEEFRFFQNDQQYFVWQDLRAYANDQVPVEIVPPLQRNDTVEFHMPRIIPGTYDVNNYGQFVRDLYAFNAQGDTLNTRRIDLNRWEITGAKELYRLSYKLDDSFDSETSSEIFEPGGTSHEPEVFLLNNFGYIGYIQDFEDYPYELHVHKPEGFYGTTALRGERGDSVDVFQVEDYFHLHDSPLLYAAPDTASLMVGNCKVEVGVYSPTGTITAADCIKEIAAVLEASGDNMGGKLPVDKYAVLVYCAPMAGLSGSYGALEHHQSTVVYLPEMNGNYFYQSLRDIVAHEFLHIITPLGIHSQYIHNFDFINPEMSEHIWLYEGVTEYNSHLVQVRKGIYSPEEFLEILRDKLLSAEQYNKNIPLTEASKYTLSYFKDQYLNFYQYGAIAGLALDLKLIDLSKGRYRLQDLLDTLGALYPADTFFVDQDLFKEIARLSYPETEEFLLRHVAGTEPFPLEALFEPLGIRYRETGVTEGWSLGCDEFSYNFETGRIMIASAEGIDEFGEDLGLEEFDELISINGQELDLGNFSEVLNSYQENLKEGDKVEMRIARPKRKGDKYKEKTLQAEAIKISYEESHQLQLIPEASAEQLARRAFWLGK